LKEKQKSPLRLFFLFFFLVIARAKKKKKMEITKLLPQQTVCKLEKKNRKFSSLRKPSPKFIACVNRESTNAP
jgi:hypothetical protein